MEAIGRIHVLVALIRR